MLLDDIRYALRQFLKTPGFTVTAILTLALGIGATTAIFTLMHAILLKSLPVARPSELIRIGDREDCCIDGGLRDDWSIFSYEQYREFRDNTRGFSNLAAFQSGRSQIGVRRVGTAQSARPFVGEFVSGNAFETFGIAAWAGRLLRASDDQKGAPPVVVMSYRAWQQKFGGDSSIVGSSFLINDQVFTVVGITPPGYFGDRLTSDPPQFWMPLNTEPIVQASSSVLDHPELDWLDIIGRGQPGANRKQIESQMQVELRQFLLSPISKVDNRASASIPKQTLHLAYGGGGIQQMQEEYKDGLHLLMWISAFVLLIACANLANLMLVRATARKPQTSVRAALGAPRSILVRQALTESIVLAVLGGVAGIGVAYLGARLLLNLAAGHSFLPIDASPSLPVLAFAFGVSLLTGVLFGTAPAWMTAHADPIEALRGANRSTRASGLWTQKILVILQAAISLALLCAAGLLIRTLSNLQHQHFGFETRNVYVLHTDAQMAGYKPDQAATLYRQIHDGVAAIPGVKSVSYSLYSPMEGNNWGTGIYIEGQAPPSPDSDFNEASWDRVSPAYFSTIGTKLVSGRTFTEDDNASAVNVAVVNQAFAHKFFHDAPIGRHFGDMDQKYAGNFEIVGVVEDAQYWDPDSRIRPMFFLPASQWAHYDEKDDKVDALFEGVSHIEMDSIEIQTVGHLPGLEGQVRNVLAQINPNLTMNEFESFSVQVKDQFIGKEILARLTSIFGLVALILAAIGLYGVTSYAVAQRTSEIGIRMALGADRSGILQMVLRTAFLQAGIGLLIGMPAAIVAGHLMAAQLYHVEPWDPAVLIGTTAILALAALVAAILPAQRAASIAPMVALRIE